ncbi:MAG: hypothetical protein IT301_01570 [Dehalococcoidia bacterium]|nr:hypothetical protein [Dehalococcoidia bacterium]
MYELLEGAKKNLIEHGELLPVLLVEGADGEVLVGLENPGATAKLRQLVLFGVGQQFAEMKPSAVVSVADAYMRRGADAPISESFADDPAARDCLIVARLTSEAECVALLCPYDRRPTLDGLDLKFSDVEEMQMPEFPALTAFFAGAGNWRGR